MPPLKLIHPPRKQPILTQPNKLPLGPPLERQPTGLSWPLTLLVVCLLSACAGTTPDAYEDPFAPKIFKEDTVVPLPTKPPNTANLIPFHVSQHSVFKFAIDPDSIRIDPDGVTRYVLVITSPSGSQQINFEGIRCETFSLLCTPLSIPTQFGKRINVKPGPILKIMRRIDTMGRSRKGRFAIINRK